MPTLYIVPTPIGNLEDITLRALRVLKEVDVIAAEDTRTTRKLLDRYDVSTRMTPFHDHNSNHKLPELIERLATSDIALVTDAGTPAISDPGQELVAAAARIGAEVVPLPGASAVTTAVAVSGIASDGFLFLGFLPRRRSARKSTLADVAGDRRVLVAFEAPHRLSNSLQDALEILGDRRIAVCREMTKLHEEVFRGTISEAVEHFDAPRGEFTLVIEGNHDEIEAADDAAVSVLLLDAKDRGMRAREAVTEVVEATGRSRRDVYALWLGLEQRPATP